MSILTTDQIQTVQSQINPDRLIKTAIALIETPSPTCSAGAVADRLADILTQDGFAVARPIADWAAAPAVVVHFDTGKPGRTLQFDGHLDTVHLPFVPPRLEDGILYGSGSSDMKGGIAAYVEALRVLRDTLPAGSILLTAHDHHEGPWGDRRQLRALIAAGYTGDAVMLPEYLADRLPVAGRGMTIFEITIRRPGTPVHEVLRPLDTPDVIAAGTQVVACLHDLNTKVASISAPHAGHDSVFVGMIQSGEIFNQSPTECTIKGTRRWVTPGQTETVLAELRQILDETAAQTHTEIEVEFDLPGDAFRLSEDDPIVAAFQSAHIAATGHPLTPGNKPFVDDGNMLAQAGIPAITHGPAATGAHTLHEEVPVAELTRVGQVYALTAIAFCHPNKS